MIKHIVFLFLWVLPYVPCIAQPINNSDNDTTLIINNEQPAPDTATAPEQVYDEDVLVSAKDYTLYESDTAIRFSNFYFNIDSLNDWKKSKKYAWSLTIDSALRNAQLKNDAAKQKRQRKSKNTEEGKDQDDVSNYNTSSNFNVLNAPLLKAILWILAACFLGFVVYQLFLSKGIFGTAGKKVNNTTVPDVAVEEDMDADYEQLYNKAYAAADFRLAMRYLFLQTLQRLHQKELLQFSVDKTNSQYVQELPQAKQNDFAQLALYYEYMWYGNVAVQPSTFDGLANKFKNFLNKI